MWKGFSGKKGKKGRFWPISSQEGQTTLKPPFEAAQGFLNHKSRRTSVKHRHAAALRLVLPN